MWDNVLQFPLPMLIGKRKINENEWKNKWKKEKEGEKKERIEKERERKKVIKGQSHKSHK